MPKTRLFVVFLWLTSWALAQSPANDRWSDWQAFLGTWRATGAGQPGEASGEFSFELELQGAVVARHSFAEYPATKDKPAYRHDDSMVIYTDPTDHNAKASYWDNEGHFIHYLVTVSTGKLVFVSDPSQPGPAYRLTYIKTAPDSLTMSFEIAPPNARDQFKTYIDATAQRDPAAAQNQKSGDAELRSMMSVYAESISKADMQLGSQVWCGSEEDSVTNPGGHWQGPQGIKALYALLSDSYSERKLTLDTVSIHSYGEFAWTEFTGDFAAKRKDGTPFSFHAAETQIYLKTHGRWCLVHVQYSTFPAEPPGGSK